MMRLMKKGFTLIELMIVIAIVAILAAIALPHFFGDRGVQSPPSQQVYVVD